MAIDWLITGAGGQFGSVLLRRLVEGGASAIGIISPTGPAPFVGKAHRVDLADGDAAADAVRGMRPRIIIHAAAVTAVGEAYRDPDRAQRVNVGATARLVELAAETGARFAFISTDLVFDGTAAPYRENDPPRPVSVYGRTKVDAERAVLMYERGLVLRPALMYGVPAAARRTTFLDQIAALRGGAPLRLFEDELRTPIHLADAAAAACTAAESDAGGVFHLGGPQRLSRLEMGRRMATALGVDGDSVVAGRQADLHSAEPRPADVSLDSGRYEKLFGAAPGRAMAEALGDLLEELGAMP